MNLEADDRALRSSLDDMAKVVGTQRQTISELREALLSAQAWVGHWQRDVEGRCMPTPESLAQAYAEIGAALDRLKGAAAPGLREALSKIANHATGGVGANPEGFVQFARAALKATGEAK